MRKKWVPSLMVVLALTGFVLADSVNLYVYVDSAPNAYGSSDYGDWKNAAFEAAANGTFINMANSSDPSFSGTTNFTIYDEVVYSFGDLGKRLHWIYWIPGLSIADFEGLEATCSFQISLVNYWNDEFQDFYFDNYGSTWLTPKSWMNYDSDGDGSFDGVIGTAGMAWWGAYGVNTQEALDADIAEWIKVNETWTFSARLSCNGDCNGNVVSITSYRTAVPEPTSLLLLGLGMAGLAAFRKRLN